MRKTLKPTPPTRQKKERCFWCGKTFSEHLDKPLPNGAGVKTPCGILKSGFTPIGTKNPIPSNPTPTTGAEDVNKTCWEMGKLSGGYLYKDGQWMGDRDEGWYVKREEAEKLLSSQLSQQREKIIKKLENWEKSKHKPDLLTFLKSL